MLRHDSINECKKRKEFATMKKMMSLILALTMALSLTACGGSSKTDAPADTADTTTPNKV